MIFLNAGIHLQDFAMSATQKAIIWTFTTVKAQTLYLVRTLSYQSTFETIFIKFMFDS